MAEETEGADELPKKPSKMPLILGIVLALVGGGGSFFAVQSGMLGGDETNAEAEDATKEEQPKTLDVAFVPLDPMVVSLPVNSGHAHLRFVAQLEVRPSYVAEVEAVRPRIVDVLNGYLRAVKVAELEDPTSLIRLRGQMLRRIQVVTGQGRINDLLIMEFVLS